MHWQDEIEWTDASSLRISLIIVMPTQRRCSDGGTSGEDADAERMMLGEFCIGTTEVPWREYG